MSDREMPICSKHWCEEMEYDLSSDTWHCRACENEERREHGDLKRAEEED